MTSPPEEEATAMAKENMNRQLDRIRRAYDLTVEQYKKGINPKIPEEIKNLPGFKAITEDTDQTSSAAPDIKEYLDPKLGMRFLDAGCCANLANYRLDRWPSTYYGVDISPALISAIKSFVSHEHISIGGLWVTDLAKLPFDENFFDIAAVIGVLEYCTLEYIRSSLSELHRVLKPQAKIILDMPNQEHPYINDMFRLEKHLGRPITIHSRPIFEEILRSLFFIERTDDSQVMLKYFVRVVKQKTRPADTKLSKG